jgi:hypothetical protein
MRESDERHAHCDYCFNFADASEFACGGRLCAHVRRSRIALAAVCARIAGATHFWETESESEPSEAGRWVDA